MIKISPIEKPAELTAEKEAELVKIYKETGRPVWRESFITDALLKMTNNKCAYSEQKLNERSAFMEVDHFKCKKLYPDEVVKWGNLLPSCKKCNVAKGDTDVVKIPIVNPLFDNPKDFLYISGLRYYAKNQIGQNTINVLKLNDLHFQMPKERIVTDYEDFFLKDWADNFQGVVTAKKLKTFLKKCRPETEFSAALSTYVLFESKSYKKIESSLKNNDLWDDELENLKSVLLSAAMPE
jgi:hypothetical protein